MKEVIWNKEYVCIPDDQRRYGMHHLVTLPANDKEVTDGVRYVYLAHARTKEPICRILIESEDDSEFSAFQNLLLMSRL